MAPSPSSLLHSLQVSVSSSRSLSFLRSYAGLSSVTYAALVVGISAYPFAGSFVAKHLRTRAKAKKRRVKTSIEIVRTLANAGVSREVIAYAMAVTDYPFSINHVESLRRLGEKNRGLRKFNAMRKKEIRRRRAEKKKTDAEGRKTAEDRQTAEDQKRRLERIVKHQQAVNVFMDVANELRQRQRPHSLP